MLTALALLINTAFLVEMDYRIRPSTLRASHSFSFPRFGRYRATTEFAILIALESSPDLLKTLLATADHISFFFGVSALCVFPCESCGVHGIKLHLRRTIPWELRGGVPLTGLQVNRGNRFGIVSWIFKPRLFPPDTLNLKRVQLRCGWGYHALP